MRKSIIIITILMLVSFYFSRGGTPDNDTIHDECGISRNSSVCFFSVEYLMSVNSIAENLVGKSYHQIVMYQNHDEEELKNPKYNACSWIGLGCIAVLIVVLLSSDFSIWDK